ncbi:MAG: (2Fe-2S)-binding protein [Paraglaciecola sp.]|uniref:(2Fe-2S)-binding protein n=1 Tax=Paraglaciecola sp. TaxID=1920173 RepID=UPI00329773E9
MKTNFILNGVKISVDAPQEATLLWTLRERLQLTGTKYSCGVSACGVCTVHLDGKPVLSCSLPLSVVEGREVTTIEGLSKNNDHAIQLAFQREQAPQCGYCFSGQVMQAASLLNENPTPTDAEIVSHMDSVLCRCGAYPQILKAIKNIVQAGRS